MKSLCTFYILAISLTSHQDAFAGVITMGVTVPNPTVLDFQSNAVGNISSADSLFSTFGITNIGIENPSAFVDNFDNRSNSSRALWHNVGGLAIVDPGTGGYAFAGDYWFMNFASNHHYFGYGDHDIAVANITVDFFSGLTNVGSVSFAHPAASDGNLEEFSFHNTDAFNMVRISSSTGAEFPLDNLTLSTVPEPGSVLLCLTSVPLLMIRRRRNRIASCSGSRAPARAVR